MDFTLSTVWQVSYFNVGGKPSTACSDTWQLQTVDYNSSNECSTGFCAYLGTLPNYLLKIMMLRVGVRAIMQIFYLFIFYFLFSLFIFLDFNLTAGTLYLQYTVDFHTVPIFALTTIQCSTNISKT